ncbi:hypothetical protein ACQUQU_09690 [Thalassolituus sp. LLYu03]|uniref:hypothetical protein n=1 Tax=Thalassolituus sp. LLYu03 TaxID=3421656 RepID=UPI003D2B30F7
MLSQDEVAELKKFARVNEDFIDFLRDAAIEYEDTSLETSYSLMRLVQVFRPEGTIARKKVAEYQLKLDIPVGDA